MTIRGIHHATMISRDAQQNVDFYTRIMGLRLVKQTVNFDLPSAYHLYYGDQQGSAASLLTFFERPDMRPGREGIGGTHHIAMATKNEDTLLMWKRWLTDHDVPVTGPYNRVYFNSIYFRDPDGLILEIATNGPGWLVDETKESLGTEVRMPPPETMRGGRDEEAIAVRTWDTPVTSITPDMQLERIHHITAIGSNADRLNQFFTETLDMRMMKQTVNFDDPGSPHLYYGIDDGAPGTIITYFAYPHGVMPPARIGTGMTHHYALEVESESVLEEWQGRLRDLGHEVTDVRDRDYFKSIYFKDPNAHIVELATSAPGFFTDEDSARLGQSLQLPDWLEEKRDEIESQLTPLRVPSGN